MFAEFAIVVKTENKDSSSRHKKYFYFKNHSNESQHQKHKDPQELCENTRRNLDFWLNKALIIFARKSTSTGLRIFLF